MHKLLEIVDNIVGALAILFSVLTPFLRPLRVRWGATDEDLRRSMPGDDLIKTSRWDYTHAVTIHAPTGEVWKWLVQIGQGRGGLYSYELLENLIGCDIHNADRILPEYQSLKVGDGIRLHPTMPALPVYAVEPERSFVLHGDGAVESGFPALTWAFGLYPLDDHSTRLVSRLRSDYPMTRMSRLMNGPLLIEPIGFVMERRMLLGIKQRAERAYRQAPAKAVTA